MPPLKMGPKLLNWASEFDAGTILQAEKTARLPFVDGHIALMPDAHVGKGSTVGSVIPTNGAIIPAAIGVDIGCGMIAVETDLNASDLPDTLDGYLKMVSQVIPAGVNQGRGANKKGETWLWGRKDRFSEPPNQKQINKIIEQYGTLGSGNHFFEVCLDERDVVWLVIHSGSRWIGKDLAEKHIKNAKRLMKEFFIHLEDPDLAYLVQGTPDFDAYIQDMRLAQDFALANRDQMMDDATKLFFIAVGHGEEINRINCHHNFTQMENHRGKNLWITRKGAIRAASGDLGVIPGSMGTRSYIVRGLGNGASYNSCSHGAGRRFSRAKAKEVFSPEDLEEMMQGKTWQKDMAKYLVDEIPGAYKDVEQVMEDQKDLVEIVHTLTQVMNYKGV